LTQASQRNHNSLPRSREFSLSEAEIIRAVNADKIYTTGTRTFTNLPKFDDVSGCGISKVDEEAFLCIEVKRLVDAAVRTEPLLLSDCKDLGELTEQGFQMLAHIADDIFYNMRTIDLETQILVMEHCKVPWLLKDAIQSYEHAHRCLAGRFRQKTPYAPTPVSNDLDAYFALVEYLTASIARWLIRSAEGELWRNQLIAILAWRTVKLKALAHDSEKYADRTLCEGEDLVRRMNQEHGNDRTRTIQITEHDPFDKELKTTVFLLHGNPDLTIGYFSNTLTFRKNLIKIFLHTLIPLCPPNSSERMAADFELCTVVYRTGPHQSMTILHEHRDGGLSASSDPFCTKNSYTALRLALENVTAIKTKQVPPHIGIDCHERTKVTWEWSEDQSDDQVPETTIHLRDLQDLISIVVPLSLAQPIVGDGLQTLLWKPSLIRSGELDDTILQFEPRNFQAKLTLSTGTFLERKKRMMSNAFDG